MFTTDTTESKWWCPRRSRRKRQWPRADVDQMVWGSLMGEAGAEGKVPLDKPMENFLGGQREAPSHPETPRDGLEPSTRRDVGLGQLSKRGPMPCLINFGLRGKEGVSQDPEGGGAERICRLKENRTLFTEGLSWSVESGEIWKVPSSLEIWPANWGARGQTCKCLMRTGRREWDRVINLTPTPFPPPTSR